jgi:hypothetical protein
VVYDRKTLPNGGGARVVNLSAGASGAPVVVLKGYGHKAGRTWADIKRYVEENKPEVLLDWWPDSFTSETEGTPASPETSDEPAPDAVSISEDKPEEPAMVEEGPSTVATNGDDVEPPKKKRGRPRKLSDDDPKVQAKRERDRERKKALREAAAAVLANGDRAAA